MFIIYSLLFGIAGALVGFAAGIGVGRLVVRITQMSSFEGKSGFFTAFCGVAGGVIGFLAAGITAGVYLWSPP